MGQQQGRGGDKGTQQGQGGGLEARPEPGRQAQESGQQNQRPKSGPGLQEEPPETVGEQGRPASSSDAEASTETSSMRGMRRDEFPDGKQDDEDPDRSR